MLFESTRHGGMQFFHLETVAEEVRVAGAMASSDGDTVQTTKTSTHVRKLEVATTTLTERHDVQTTSTPNQTLTSLRQEGIREAQKHISQAARTRCKHRSTMPREMNRWTDAAGTTDDAGDLVSQVKVKAASHLSLARSVSCYPTAFAS